MKTQSTEHRQQMTDHRPQTIDNRQQKNSLESEVWSLKSKKGFTLIEVLIALTILSIGLLGVAMMQVSAITGNAYSREMAVATKLGQDLLERLLVMPYTDTSVSGAVSPGTVHPIAADVTANWAPAVNGSALNVVDERGLWTAFAATLVPAATAGPQIYTRIWTVIDDQPVAGMKTITVTVSWEDRQRQQLGLANPQIQLIRIKVQ